MANSTPSAQGFNQTAAPGTSIPLTSLFTYFDADGLSDILTLDVRDRTVGGGYLTFSGFRQTDNVIFETPISQFGQWAFVVGPSGSSDVIGFNVNDRAGAFNPSATATVSATASVNHTPTAQGFNQTAAPGTSISLTTLFSYSDADGLSDILTFDVRDRTVGGGYLTFNGARQTDNVIFERSISQIGQWAFVVGPSGSSDDVGFNVNDRAGAFNPSATATVSATASVNHTPTAQGFNQTAAPGTSISLTTLFSYSDADGLSDILTLDVRDRTVGGGYLTFSGARQTDNVIFETPISQIGLWAFVVGSSGSRDEIGFNVIDRAGAFNPSATATVTASSANRTPTAQAFDQKAPAGTSIALTSLFTYADADGSSDIISFSVQDRSSGGGFLTFQGIRQADNSVFTRPISEIGQWAYVVGPSGSADTIGFNAIDRADAFNPSVTATVTTSGTNRAPTAQAVDQKGAAGASIQLSTLFTYADADGSSDIVSFSVQDRSSGGGYLTFQGVRQADNSVFTRPISEIGQWAYVVGPSGSVDTIGFNAIDKANAFNPSVTATVTTSGTNRAPTAQAFDQKAAAGTSIQLSTLFSYADADGASDIVSFSVQDRSPGGGYLTFQGRQQADNSVFTRPISEIGQWGYVVGPNGSFDTIGFNAIDKANAFNPSVTATVSTPGSVQVNYRTLVDVRSLANLNVDSAGKVLSSPLNSTMKTLLGTPDGPITTDYSTNTALASPFVRQHLVTDTINSKTNIGTVTGLDRAIESLKAIFARIAADLPDLTPHIGDAGMYNARTMKPTDGRATTNISNHTWGTAIDLSIDSLTDNTKGSVFKGIAEVIPYFNAAGWVSGAAWHTIGTQDNMHFELSKETLQSWYGTTVSAASAPQTIVAAAGQNTLSIDGTSLSGGSFTVGGQNQNVVVSRSDGSVVVRATQFSELAYNGGSGADSLTVGSLKGTDIADHTVYFNGNGGDDLLDASNGDKSIVADGGSGNDRLIGGASDDDLQGGAGDDTITGGGGSDMIEGGDGTNTALYTRASKSYVISVTAGSPSVAVQDKTGGDGFDSLLNVQKIQFSETTVETDWFTKTASLSSVEISKLTQLYIASFNRAPDALGLDYWGARYKDGMSILDIAGSFFVQPEATAAYPAGLATRDFVTQVYGNVLGRSADAAGLAYWTAQLQAGAVAKSGFLLAIINGVLGADIQYMANKESVGAHFALAQGLSNASWAKTVMSGVTVAASSVAAANAQSDAFAATAASATSGELIVKILGIAS